MADLITPATKYGAIPEILVRKHRAQVRIREFMHRELKSGGSLRRYYEFKRAQTAARLRAVAIRVKDFEQAKNVDARVVAHVPLFDYLMCAKMDKDFWNDPANIKSYKRDNPDFAAYK